MIKPFSQFFIGLLLLAVSVNTWIDFYMQDIVATLAFAFVIVPLFGTLTLIGGLNMIGSRR